MGDGVLDLHCMNICLLLKWWWKLKDSNYTSIWNKLYLLNIIISFPSRKCQAISALHHLGQTDNSVLLGKSKDIVFFFFG
jgi:hypothetical protein